MYTSAWLPFLLLGDSNAPQSSADAGESISVQTRLRALPTQVPSGLDMRQGGQPSPAGLRAACSGARSTGSSLSCPDPAVKAASAEFAGDETVRSVLYTYDVTSF